MDPANLGKRTSDQGPNHQEPVRGPSGSLEQFGRQPWPDDLIQVITEIRMIAAIIKTTHFHPFWRNQRNRSQINLSEDVINVKAGR